MGVRERKGTRGRGSREREKGERMGMRGEDAVINNTVKMMMMMMMMMTMTMHVISLQLSLIHI